MRIFLLFSGSLQVEERTRTVVENEFMNYRVESGNGTVCVAMLFLGGSLLRRCLSRWDFLPSPILDCRLWSPDQRFSLSMLGVGHAPLVPKLRQFFSAHFSFRN